MSEELERTIGALEESLLSLLAEEVPTELMLSDFKFQVIIEGVVLVTYRSVRHDLVGQPELHSRRSSIWKKSHGAWRLVFHQGTPSFAVSRRVRFSWLIGSFFHAHQGICCSMHP